MKSVEMNQLYETLLCSPGMKEIVKVDVRISRKSILLLSQIIQKGLCETGNQNLEFANIAGAESSNEFELSRKTANFKLSHIPERSKLSDANKRSESF